MNSSYLVLLSVRIFLLTLILMLFLTLKVSKLVSSLGAQEACPLMLCLTSTKPLSWIIYNCTCVWAPHQRNHLDRLKKVQWKITRTLFFKQFPNADVRPPYSNRAYWFRYCQGWGCSQNSKADSGFQDFEWFGPCFFWFLHSAQQIGEY